MKRLIATLLTALGLLGAPSAVAAVGEHFSFAPAAANGTQAPAFLEGLAVPPGPDARAWWAGVCDLRGGIAATAAQPPVNGRFADCIEYQADPAVKLQPPLAPGVVPAASGPDGWYERDVGPLVGPAWRLVDVTQAGGHADGSASFWLSRAADATQTGNVSSTIAPDGSPRDIRVSLPPGVIGNPNAVPKCPSERVNTVPTSCPPRTQVGVSTITLSGTIATYPVYNVEPRDGKVAEFVISGAAVNGAPPPYKSNQPAVAAVRTDGDFGADVFADQIPPVVTVLSQSFTVWAVPWAKSHDIYRPIAGYCGSGNNNVPGMYTTGLRGGSASGCSQEPQSYDPSWGPIRPFFTTQTECSTQNPVTRIFASNYHTPVTDTRDSVAPLVTGCPDLSFPADISLQPTTRRADSPSGLDVDLTIPQNNDPPESVKSNPDDDTGAPAFWKSKAGLAVSHLQDTTVTLPEGFSINPAAANSQGVCTTAQIGLTTPIGSESIRFDNDDPSDGKGHECPEAAKIGTTLVETPLLDEADWPTGEVYLAAQKDNPFGSNYAIYLVLRSVKRGLTVKLAGEVKPDPVTGRLTTTVSDNPQLPFDKFELHFKGGPQAPLATSPVCATGQNHTLLAPYSDPGSPVVIDEDVVVNQAAAGGACPTSLAGRPFNLGFSAGSTKLLAGQPSPFTVRLTRPDGTQELDRVSLTAPEGLVAKLAGVPYCPEADIAAAIARTAVGDGTKEKADPSCPASSQVGTTTIGAGAGISPVYVQGKVYLAGPYKGAPLSLAFVVPAVAGPFDLGVQVVRTALNVNPKTAQVTASSDEIPKILAGVPLRIRDIRVDIDRDGFTLNPTDCSEQQVSGVVSGASGASLNVSNRFQVAECARLGFKPKLTLQLKGGTKRTKYQGLTAIVTPRPGDANIAKTSVTMPRSAFLAQEHIRTVCTRVQWAADACPVGSIYGKATAWSPLLDEPLSGNVYLRSSDNKLPDLVADLRGPANQPIRVELSGRTDSFKGALRNTFDVVPDAAVTKFRLDLFGGNKGLIVNSQDLCKKKHFATVKMDGQNGRTHNFRPVVKNGCTEKQIRKAQSKGKKRQSKQAKSRTASALSLADLARGLF